MDFLCEYTVQRKKEGLYRFAKAGIIALWILIPIAVIIIGFSVASNDGIWVLGYATVVVVPPLAFFLAKGFYPATAAFAEVDYEYTIASGEMSVAKIFGNRFRREWFNLKISDMERCAPYNADAQREISAQSFDKVYMAASSMDAKQLYYAIFRNSRGEYCIMYFEVIKKSLKMIKTYFPSTVMSSLEY